MVRTLQVIACNLKAEMEMRTKVFVVKFIAAVLAAATIAAVPAAQAGGLFGKGGASASGANVQTVVSETNPVVALFDCATGVATVDGRAEGPALTDMEPQLTASLPAVATQHPIDDCEYYMVCGPIVVQHCVCVTSPCPCSEWLIS